MDEVLKTLGPLLGVVLGSLLTGIRSYFKERAEHKRVLASALTDLLEVRHRLVSTDLAIKELRSKFGAPAEVVPHIRNLQDALLPGATQLDDRYDSAVTLLSGIDPVLSFTLRSKNSLPRVLGMLRQTATTGGTNLAQFEKMESTLRSAAIPSLNDAILELAWAHSIRTWIAVRRLLSDSATLPPEAIQFFEALQSELNGDPNRLPAVSEKSAEQPTTQSE